jgi:putative addiction module antidote
MTTLKITTVGHSLAITIPKELVNRFHLEKGDEVFVRETPEGFEVSPFDPDFKAAMEAAAVVSKQYKNALRALAQK